MTKLPHYNHWLIVQKVRETDWAQNEGEQMEQLMSTTEEILDRVSGSFVETMLFANSLCEAYGVSREFPSEQRRQALYDCDDWRNATFGGLWHIIYASLKEEIGDPTDFTNTNANQQNHPIKSTVTYNPSAITKTTENLLHLNQQEPESSIHESSWIEHVEQTLADIKEEPLHFRLLVLDNLADEYGFESYPGMTDTAAREEYTCGHFVNSVVTNMYSEFLFIFDPDQSNSQKEASHPTH